MQLSECIGQQIGIFAPRLHAGKFLEVKLHGVEAGGIWIESQGLTNEVLETMGLSSAPRTLVLFLPYHEIGYVLKTIPGAALNEKAFGV